MLIHDLHVRVINSTTGELLRELTINPDYQPTGKTRYPHRNTKQTEPLKRGFGQSGIS
jgi:hypothetical protein